MSLSLLRALRRPAAALLTLLLATSPAAAQETQRLNGDVNNDQAITAQDAQAVLRSVVELSIPETMDIAFGDADCDGAVTALDAQIILAHVVQLDVAQFCVGKVAGGEVSTVAIDAGTGKVLVNGTLQLKATARNATNAAITGKTFTWSSSDVTKATVSSTGLVTGIATGTVTITATTDGVSGIATVTVDPASTVRRVVITPSVVTVIKDDSVRLAATVLDAAGNPLGDQTITWTSANTAVATVDANGQVKGVTLGSADIGAAATGATAATAKVTVASAAAVPNRSWVGTTSDDWGTASNWSPAQIPLATDTLLIPTGTPHSPVLRTSTGVAGLVIVEGAKLDIGGNELQITGRLDVDGQVIGTATSLVTVQGVNAGISYVRGTLPSVRVSGETVLMDSVKITGNLEVIPGAILHMNGQVVEASGNLNMRGVLLMRSPSALLNVRGNGRFFTDRAVTTELSDGVLRVGGNLEIATALATQSSPFPATNVHRTILDGAAAQTVSMSTLPIAEFQELDVENTAGGVVFTAGVTQRFRVKGHMDVLTGTSISGSGRVNVFRNFTSAPNGSLSLVNLAVAGAIAAGGGFRPDTLTLLGGEQLIPYGPAYDYQTVVGAGASRFTGPTTVNGSLIIGCLTDLADCGVTAGESVDVAGRSVVVKQDVRQSKTASGGQLLMVTDGGQLTIQGGLLGPVGPAPIVEDEFLVTTGSWTAGTVNVGGAVRLRGQGASGTHHVILDGASPQNLRVRTGFAFQGLTLSNAGTVMNDTTATVGRRFIAAVRGDLNITTASTLSGTGRLDLAGNLQTTTGSNITLGAMSIGSVMRVSGGYSPDTAEFNNAVAPQTIQNLPGYRNVLVRGEAVFGGSMTFDGSLEVLGTGQLNVESRHVTVTKDLKVDGVLRMQDPRDSLTVLGNATFTRAGDPNAEAYAIDGVLRVHGNISGGQAGGFYPAGNHRTVWTPASNKTASGTFRHLEVRGTQAASGLPSVTLDSAMVRGNLTITDGVLPVRVRRSHVEGNAVLGQDSTVTIETATTVQGNLEISGRVATNSTNTFRVFGDLAMTDGAWLTGYVIHRGRYTEQGSVRLTDANGNVVGYPALEGVSYLRYTQQPGNVTAGSPFAPEVTVELLGPTNARVPGTALVRLVSPTSLTGTTRIITSDGVGTFSGLTDNASSTSRQLYARLAMANCTAEPCTVTVTSFMSSQYTVAAAATRMQIAALPASLEAGATLTNVTDGAPRVRVDFVDGAGAPVAHTGPVSIAVLGTADGLKGTTTVDAAGATFVEFTDLRIEKAQANLRLVATAPGIEQGQSANFTIVAAAPAELRNRYTYGNWRVGSTISGSLELRDAFGNVASNYAGTELPMAAVTLTSGSGTLSISGTWTYANGIFSSSNLALGGTMDGEGTATITFTVPIGTGLTATSNEFIVLP